MFMFKLDLESFPMITLYVLDSNLDNNNLRVSCEIVSLSVIKKNPVVALYVLARCLD